MSSSPRRFAERLEPRVLLSAGALDPSFGTGGTLAVQFPGGISITVVRDSLVQPDGKVVITGEAPDAAGGNRSDFAVARLNPDGTPDLSFNAGAGIFVYPSPGNIDEGSGVALQSDGKIVVSATFGETEAGVQNYGLFAVGRFNADGTLDLGFGDEGAIAIDFSADQAFSMGAAGHDVLIGADDKITLVGYATTDLATGASSLALARLNPDGTYDPTFGTGGKVLANLNGDSELGLSGALDPAGNILVTGTAGAVDGDRGDFFTARFLFNGSVDTSFGEGGSVYTDFSDPSADIATLAVADAVTVQPDGKIVVGGLVAHADAAGDATVRIALARYDPDGSPDIFFGDDLGQIESNLGRITSINKLFVDADGRIITSGLSAPTIDDASNRRFNPFVAQYTPDGELDPTFANGGFVIINPPPGLTTQSAAPVADAPALLRTLMANAVGITAAESTSQQASDVIQQQSAVVVALGDKLLVVTTASDQLTATRLIGNGADLAAGAAKGIKVNSVLGGAKAAVAVPVTNVGNEDLAGTVSVSVVLSTDGTAAGAVATAATASYRVSLKTGRAKTFKIKFAYPTGLADGSYVILAVADGGAADVNAANNAGAAPAPVTVAKPFVDLGGAFGALPPLSVGGKAKLTLALQNAGNVPAKGTARVTVYASTDAAADPADRAFGPAATFNVGIKQGATKAAKVSLVVPADLAPGTYYLIAVLDDTGLADTNLANNTLISGTPIGIA